MERPRVWSKRLKLPCALEHAVLRARVFKRAETWTPAFIQKASVSPGNYPPGSESENDIVLPPEDPLLVVLDRFRKHHDEVDAGDGVLRCWAKLADQDELFRRKDDNEEDKAEPAVGSKVETRNCLAVYEMSDGILTETGGLLNGTELREVTNRSIKLLNVLTCPVHKGKCLGCRDRYRLGADSQSITSPPYSTDLAEIILFNDVNEEDSHPTVGAIWKDFAVTLVDYYAYMEDWLPELILARSSNSSETLSLIPTSNDTLELALEIDIQDSIRAAPVNWILNDSRPDIGTICQLTPTNETAIFLKTLGLQDASRLEQRVLKGLGRILGKRAVEVLHAGGVATRTGPPSQIKWALLWMPENHVVDPGDKPAESLTSGRHRLWPKSLLSPLDDGKSNENINQTGPPITIELAEYHIGAKKPTAVYNESLKIQEAIEEYKTQQAAKAQEKPKLDNDLSRYSDKEDLDTHGTDGTAGYLSVSKSDWPIPVNDVIEDEDEDDLFASSPSPALAEESTVFLDPASGQENPIAIDSVEQASASMFTPTHHSDPQYAPIKYDVSPTDLDGRTKVDQNGLETMITDDDFDFFDANAELPLDMSMQQMTYEEYGDLSGTDFGVNLNQPTAQRVPDWNGGHRAQPNATSVVNAVDSGLRTADGTPVANPEIENAPGPSPQSDDDLWHDEYNLAEPVPMGVVLISDPTSDSSDTALSPRSTLLHPVQPIHCSITEEPISPATDENIAFAAHFTTSTYTSSAPDASHGCDPVDYGQPLQWALVKSLERMIPVGFDEVSFQSLGRSNHISFTVDDACVADKYGDGRVRHRTQLLQMLKEEQSVRQQRGHRRLPFHLDHMDLDNDAFSAASTVSDRDDVFADSADDASEITAASSMQNGPDRTQGLFTLGQYPFSSDGHLLSTGFSVTLEEHDSMTLRKRVIESNDSRKRFEAYYRYPEGEGFVDTSSTTASACPSALKSSDMTEYIDTQGIEIDTRVRVSQQGNVMELSSTSLPYWSELSLEPISGRKDVIVTVIYQKGIRMSEIKAFFLSIANVYATLNFGSHTLAPGGEAIQEIGSDLNLQVSTLQKGTEREGYRICYVLLQPGNAAASALLITEQDNVIKDVTVLPIYIQDLSHPKAYCCLSSKVYHSLQRVNRPYQARLQYPSFIIAPSSEQRTINFAIRWPPPALDVIEGERSLHVAYAYNMGSKSLMVSLIDDCGQAWREHECRVISAELAVQEVWAYAMTFVSMANVHWRLVLAREGVMTYAELQAWHGVFREESQAASGAFQAELILCMARAADTDTTYGQTSRVKHSSHRQCIFIDRSSPKWVSPLCSSTIQYGCMPGKRYPRTPSLDLHLLLRMATESAGLMQSDVEVLTRMSQQFDGLRILGIHRWGFPEHSPLPAHLYAVQRHAKEQVDVVASKSG
ncbi:hypothetical protein QFC21_004602 [Naganishia friedmannii]|uniref:Uncharacterized protein n=1 Tax=Naganishia friedmannii TaxID=89922 RepID=A0ACC2VFY6_9TREE|nr:hypothetical protein QFC21_004602 [Naganishia friedmannii]